MKQGVLFLILLTMYSFGYAQDNPSLLIVIPTRENPEQFIETLDQHYAHLSGDVEYHFLISCDLDDLTMNNTFMKDRLKEYPKLKLVFGNRLSRTEMYQRDTASCEIPFDIIVAANDHFIPTQWGFDKVIVEQMVHHFPHHEGVINFQTVDTGKNINTLPVVGKQYYAIFGSLYNAEYRTLSKAQEELTMVTRMLGREALVVQPLFSKAPSARATGKLDRMYADFDEKTFKTRFASAFSLEEDFISQFLPKMWSILILTLDERVDVFSYITKKLNDQILANGLQDKVEVLFFKDNREYSIGYKRNALMRQSRGMYVNFIDDDDDIHDNYIKMIYEAIQKKPDSVTMTGLITFDGQWPSIFKHGIEYQTHFKQDEIFYNPPNHISTMKRSVAARFPFLDISYGEDLDWSLQISRSKLLKTEVEISTPYYFYKYVTK